MKGHVPEDRNADVRYCLKIGRRRFLPRPYNLLVLSSLGIWYSNQSASL
jgi:hypothetical protein